jgi:hypothetical protein
MPIDCALRDNHLIRKLSNGVVTIVAGTGQPGEHDSRRQTKHLVGVTTDIWRGEVNLFLPERAASAQVFLLRCRHQAVLSLTALSQ